VRGNCGAARIRRGEEALRRYVTAPPTSQDAEYAAATANLAGAPGHPRRAAILLRAAAALAAAERAAARAAALKGDPGRRPPAGGPDVIHEGISLLAPSPSPPGLAAGPGTPAARFAPADRQP
jgi:hypothetical protein